jgi:hypothetical protein
MLLSRATREGRHPFPCHSYFGAAGRPLITKCLGVVTWSVTSKISVLLSRSRGMLSASIRALNSGLTVKLACSCVSQIVTTTPPPVARSPVHPAGHSSSPESHAASVVEAPQAVTRRSATGTVDRAWSRAAQVVSARTRAAANSSARGIPSSRRHTGATAGKLGW